MPHPLLPNMLSTQLGLDASASLVDFDVDGVLRPLLAVGLASVREDAEHAPHQHRKGQLLYATRGVIHCEVESYCLFVEPTMAPALPAVCCTVAVSPLLRELIAKAACFPTLTALHGAQERLVATLLDELASAPVEDLHLPIPRDARLRRLAALLLAQPADKSTLAEWARRIGMSERSMTRQSLEEMGMSVGRWRRQLHVILALQGLAQGHSVKAVALELGYENTSGFVTMFRKAVGKPPARYLAQRESGRI